VRRYRFAAKPQWLAGHLLCAALIVTMILLGRWQLTVSNEKHFDIQNFGYAIQWWLFSAAAGFFWARLLRDTARRDDATPDAPAEGAPQPEPPVAYRRYVMPTAAAQPADDPVHAAYNAYLAKLAAQDAEKRP
jgi:DNA-binding transcriptional regulator of glucitol operon